MEAVTSGKSQDLDETGVGKLSVQVHLANILGFVGHLVSATATQLCSYSGKVAIDLM